LLISGLDLRFRTAEISQSRPMETILVSCFWDCEFELITFEAESRLTRIEDLCFSSCSLKLIIIPRSVEVICDSSFQSCRSLSAISFATGSKLARIGSDAFYDSRVESVVPRNVEFIDAGAFNGCSRLSGAAFEPDSRMISIESLAFRMTAHASFIYPEGRNRP
jgi:hypothetical protein